MLAWQTGGGREWFINNRAQRRGEEILVEKSHLDDDEEDNESLFWVTAVNWGQVRWEESRREVITPPSDLTDLSSYTTAMYSYPISRLHTGCLLSTYWDTWNLFKIDFFIILYNMLLTPDNSFVLCEATPA